MLFVFFCVFSFDCCIFFFFFFLFFGLSFFLMVSFAVQTHRVFSLVLKHPPPSFSSGVRTLGQMLGKLSNVKVAHELRRQIDE